MKKHLGIAPGICFLLAFTTVVNAMPDRFSIIPRENVFRLNPRKPETITPPPQVERPQITLQGITTILGRTQALLNIQRAAKSAASPQSSFVLSEGESRYDVTVLEINARTGTVRLNNVGSELTLALAL